MKAFVAKYFQTIVIIGVGVLIYILFSRSCNGGNDKLDALKAENKQLQARYRADSITHAQARARWEDSISNAAVNSDLQVKVIKETEKKLQASQSRINQLTAVIRNQPGPVDSSFVLVSPEFKEACDSLPGEIDKQNLVIASLKENNDGLVDLMNYEIVYRDSLIEAEQENVKRISGFFNQQTIILQNALKAAKPKGAFLIGVGLLGNEERFLGGASVKAGYLTKKQKLYMYSPHMLKLPGMTKAGIYHEATVMFNPFR